MKMQEEQAVFSGNQLLMLNTLKIKCFSGMAVAVCTAIDSMEWTGVVGTISGDDTIFVLCKTEDFAKIFTMNMEKILNAKNS